MANAVHNERSDSDLPVEVEFLDYFRVLWNRRVLILATVVTVGLAALVVNLMIEPVYEASALVVVNQLQSDGEPAGDLVVQVFLSSRVADEVVQSFGLADPPHELTADALISSAMSVETVIPEQLFRVSARFNDPELAADVATAYALGGIDLAVALDRQQATEVRDALAVQFDMASQDLDQRQADLLTLQNELQIEVDRAELQSDLALFRALTTVDRGGSRFGQASVGLSFLFPEGQLLLSADGLREIQALVAQASSEVGNDALSSALESLRARLAEVYEAEGRLRKAELDVELSEAAFRMAAARYAESRLEAEGEGPRFQLVDEARPPASASGPRVLRNVVLAAVLALLLSATLAFLLTYAEERGAAGEVSSR